MAGQQVRGGGQGLTFRDHRGENPVGDRAEPGHGSGVPGLRPEQDQGLVTVDGLLPVRGMAEVRFAGVALFRARLCRQHLAWQG